MRSRERTASHSSFFSHNSRRERAEAPAWAAALRAAACCSCCVEDGSLGLAELVGPFGLDGCLMKRKWMEVKSEITSAHHTKRDVDNQPIHLHSHRLTSIDEHEDEESS